MLKMLVSTSLNTENAQLTNAYAYACIYMPKVIGYENRTQCCLKMKKQVAQWIMIHI